MSTNIEANYPLIYAQPPEVRLAVCYNPFLPHDLALKTLVYNQNFTLADYLEGLPEEAAWSVAYNGEPALPEVWSTIKPAPNSTITLLRIPEGGKGGGGKQILRLVAMLAVAAFAAWAGPIVGGFFGAAGTTAFAVSSAVASAAITMAGGLLINALLPAQPINKDTGPQSQSYGITGPKNTAREGVPFPIVYGEYRVGGNIVDLYTRNFGDDQYLFMRTVLNDGPVASITEIELNNQPIFNYKDVEYRVNLGRDDELPVGWFNEAIRMENVQQKITTGGVVHRSKGPLDRLRIDVAFPAGLIETVVKSGNVYPGNVYLAIDYRLMSDNGITALSDWAPLPLEAERPLDTSGGSGNLTVTQSNKASFTIYPTAPLSGNEWSVEAQYRAAGSNTWISVGTRRGEYTAEYYFDRSDANDQASYNYSYGLAVITWDLSFPQIGDWEVRFIGGAVQNNTNNNPNLNTYTQNNLPGSIANLHVQRKTQTPFNISYNSAKLPRGRYEVRVTRSAPEDADRVNKPSQCWVNDVSEIDAENVSYAGTAMLSLKIKLSDQISSQPTLTALVRGSLLKIYDDDGDVVSTQWSNNPADVLVDILCNPDRGGGAQTSRVIWPKISEWREFCTANDLKFNAVFDFVTTQWDALQSVARVGHAALIPQGTRYSVAIDKPRDPVMLFTGSNMYMDTFSKTWTSLDDRANEVQQSFYDSQDGYKQKTIRIPDATAQSRGDPVKPATASGFGITSVDQATLEAEYQARQNSYTTNSLIFDAPLEAMGLSIGDVALIQHDSIKYGDGVGGRLEAGSTTTEIKLDRPVTMNTGKTYHLLITTPALKLFTANITNVNGNKLTVTGLPLQNLPRIRRLIKAGRDVEITKAVQIGETYVLTVDDGDGFTTGSADIWDTDVITERSVMFSYGEQTEVTLTSPLPAAPEIYTNFLFGEAVSVKQPYTLTGISGDDDLFRRTLAWSNYDDRIYAPGSWGVPQITQSKPDIPTHVLGLLGTFEQYPKPTQSRIPVTLVWTRPVDTREYGGADIYVSRNGSNYAVAGSVSDITTWTGDYNREDTVRFKVVAFDKRSNRAPFDTAPLWGTKIVVSDPSLASISGISFTVPYFRTEATANLSWSMSTEAPDGYRVDYKPITNEAYTSYKQDYDDWLGDQTESQPVSSEISSDNGYIAVGRSPVPSVSIPRLDIGGYVVRIRAEKGFASSEWYYFPLLISAPELPTRVTGLRLNMGTPDPLSDVFNGQDAKFVWNDVSASASGFTGDTGADVNGMDFYWRDYQVRVYTADGSSMVREEYTREAAYTYTFEKNVEDCADLADVKARRSFKIEVRIRGRQGQLTDAAIMTVSNPAPPLPDLNSTTVGVDTVYLRLGAVKDNDLLGVRVWASATADFTPSDENLVFSDIGQVQFNATPQVPVYFRYAAYDVFGVTGLNVSAEYQATPRGIDSTYITPTTLDGITVPATISEEILARIGLVDGNGPGSVNARIDGVRTEMINSEAGLSSRIDSVVSSAGNRIFYGSETPTATAVNDIWINPSDFNRVKVWNGVNWVYADDQRIASTLATLDTLNTAVTSPTGAIATRIDSVAALAVARSRTFRQATSPTGSSEDPIRVGDLWINSADNNRLMRWNGLAWADTSDARLALNAAAITTESQARTTQNEATASQISILSATATSKNRTFLQGTAPTATAVGDIWIDSADTNKIKRWNGTTWVDTSDSRLSSNVAAITAEQQARANEDIALSLRVLDVLAVANARNRVYRQPLAPTSPTSGDLWFDTSDGNKPKRWNGTTWEDTTDTRLTTNAANISSLQFAVTDPNGSVANQVNTVSAQAVARNKTFSQGTAPTALGIGDLWINTANQNRLMRWNGSAWVETTDTRVALNAAAITDEQAARSSGDSANALLISGVSAVANSKATVFRQSNAPTATAVGDLWINTGNKNRLSRWNGTVWQDSSDVRIDENIAAITELQYAVSDNNGSVAQRIATVTSLANNNTARIATEETTRANADTALATRASTLESAVATKNTVYRAFTAPPNPVTGDLWFDLNVFIWKRWSGPGGSWEDVTDARVASTLARLITEETTRATADSALATRATNLESTVNSAGTGVTALNARITTEETTRASADSALASRATTLESAVNNGTTGLSALNARIAAEETTRANADSATASTVSSLTASVGSKATVFRSFNTPTATAAGDLWFDLNNNSRLMRWPGGAGPWEEVTDYRTLNNATNITTLFANISTEQTTRATADSALASRASALEVTINTPSTGLSARASALEGRMTAVESGKASASDVSSLTAQINNPSTGLAATIARISTEESVRASVDAALTVRTTALESTVNNVNTGLPATFSRLTTEETTRATADTALATRATTLESTVNNGATGIGALNARIAAEETTRANADSATASTLSALTATVNTKNTVYRSFTTPTSPVAGDLWFDLNVFIWKRWSGPGGSWEDVTDARVASTLARLITEETTRATADSSLAARATTLESTVNNAGTGVAAVNARLTTEETTRANADSALASRATTLESTVNNGTTGVSALNARIAAEETTRANADSAAASTVNSLTATVGTKARTFWDWTAPTASAVGDLWVDLTNGQVLKRWNGSSWGDMSDYRTINNTTNINTLFSGLATEQSVRSTADATNATAISNLTSTVNGQTASITTLQTTTANLSGAMSASYSLRVNAGGRISGFSATSGGAESAFTIEADRFRVWNGSAANPAFEVVGGNVFIGGNQVRTQSMQVNAVTKAALSRSSGGVSVPANTWTEVQSVSLGTDGGDVRVDFSVSVAGNSSASGDNTIYALLQRDGWNNFYLGQLTVIPAVQTYTLYRSGTAVFGDTVEVSQMVNSAFSQFAIDTGVPAGNRNYKLFIFSQRGVQVLERALAVLETKR